MSTDASTPTPASGFGRACTQAALTGFRFAHSSLWRLLCLFGKLLLIAYFLFCLMFLVLRYAVLPNIDRYKSNVEQLASHATGQPLTIGRIDAGWTHFTPRLVLTDVVIHDQAGGVALRLPRVTAGLSWWSAVVGALRLDTLEIDKADLDIQRDRAGRLFVAGIFIDTGKSGDGGGADWILSQRRIVIRDGRVRWNDAQRGAPELVLENVNFRLENQWQGHAFALSAVPPSTLAAPLDLRGKFTHPHFARRISDVSQWSGTLYADVRSPALAAWGAYVDYPIALTQGSGSVRSWLRFNQQKVVDLSADLHLSDVSARLSPELPLLQLAAVDGRISLQEEFGADLRTAATAEQPVAAAFGAGFADASGALDRARMRALVFSDPPAKATLEAILHPRIRAGALAAAAAATGDYVMYAVPLLVESGTWRDRVSRVLAVDCREEVQIARVMARNNLTEAQVRAIMAAQASRVERLAAADDVIDNNDGLDALAPQIDRLHAQYLKMRG